MTASSGNEGSGCSTINSPPSFEPRVMTVGATQFKSDQIAPFSSRGPIVVKKTDRSRRLYVKPDIVAPGTRIRAAYLGHGFASFSGTSMASPHVAGAVLLISSACPHILRDIETIENVLLNAADPIKISDRSMLCGNDTLESHPNFVYGWGMLQVDRAIQLCL